MTATEKLYRGVCRAAGASSRSSPAKSTLPTRIFSFKDNCDPQRQPPTVTWGKQMWQRSPWEQRHLVAVAAITPGALSHGRGRLRRPASPCRLSTPSARGRAGPGLPRRFPREPLLAVWARLVPSLSFPVNAH